MLSKISPCEYFVKVTFSVPRFMKITKLVLVIYSIYQMDPKLNKPNQTNF